MSTDVASSSLLSKARWLSSAICFGDQINESMQEIVLDNTNLLPSTYPQARRDETIVDNYHGNLVVDPYRWLENVDSEETKAFIANLNKISATFFDQSNVRDKFEEKMMKMHNWDTASVPYKRGDFIYTYHNDGSNNHSILYQSTTYEKKGKVFFDVNKLSEDGLISIWSTSWSYNGKYVAFGLSEKGEDFLDFKFMKNNGEELEDKILNITGGVSWLPNNEGVLYTKYTYSKSVKEDGSVFTDGKYCVYYHRIETDTKNDVMVAYIPSDPTAFICAYITGHPSLIVVSGEKRTTANSLYYHVLEGVNFEVDGNLNLKPLFTDGEHKYEASFLKALQLYSQIICTVGDGEALIMTNRDAPMFKLIRIKLEVAEKDPSTWITIIPEDKKRLLQNVWLFAYNKLLLYYYEISHTAIEIHDLETGEFVETLPLPMPICFVYNTTASLYSDVITFSYESLTDPPTTVRVNYAQEREEGDPLKMEVLHKRKYDDYDPSKYESKMIFYNSKDGTKIPMIIAAAKDVKLDSNNPTLLEGYVGFSTYLQCKPSTCALLQNFHGIYAFAFIRGGGEYGRDWHDGGRLDKQQNSFDDFQAAAKWLIDNKYTRPERLAIKGGSKGGLLVAACAQQAPHLFGAVVAECGVYDMYRQKYHSNILYEYGDPWRLEHFEFLRKYSPIHNIRFQDGKQWPAMLLWSGDFDVRVKVWHTLKYIAEMYHVAHKDGTNIPKHPILARIEADAGHGQGLPLSKSLKRTVEMYAFLARVLKLEWKD
ncbi:Prolyl endopeptidase [Aphelenchoides besseyi]|nr:Prolyl endopeptidase [Aphelenchoides besseyi]